MTGAVVGWGILTGAAMGWMVVGLRYSKHGWVYVDVGLWGCSDLRMW